MSEQGNNNSITPIHKWLIAGILLSFAGGIALFATIAQTKSGDPIPPDANPYSVLDSSVGPE